MILRLRPWRLLVAVGCLLLLLVPGGIWLYAGAYGLNVVARHGVSFWLPVGRDSARLSPSMRRALAGPPPVVTAAALRWRSLRPGFEVASLPVLADGHAVDRIQLARIDPARFRFVVRSAPAGDKDLDQWMAALTGAALVVNGSYFGRYGAPDTPFLSDGVLQGPREYDAKACAFVASDDFAGVRDLGGQDWRTAFQGAANGMVSYPLLVIDGKSHVGPPSDWLANRSFVGQDRDGRVLIGTTEDAFFTLGRLAQFLADAPLDLALALNLDGGPVACQGIDLAGFDRRSYGRWEAQVTGDKVALLSWPYGGTAAMPVVLAVYQK